MSLAGFLDDYEREHPPRAVVERIGRWTYSIVVEDGLIRWGPGAFGVQYGWLVLGRKRAERKAHKVLARYHREQARFADRFEVGP